MSSLPYVQQLSKVIVAQITQTIGWNSIQTTPLELLTDILHKYLEELTRQTQRYAELYGRTEPNLDDVALAFNDLSINISDLEEYIANVDPVPCIVNVPKFPIPKESNLNFLKPGSKEVVTRPVHVHEHLPPIHPYEEPAPPTSQPQNASRNADEENNANFIQTYITTKQISSKSLADDENIFPTAVVQDSESIDAINVGETTVIENHSNDVVDDENTFKKPYDAPKPLTHSQPASNANITENGAVASSIGKATREIISCFMTTSGFISPSREGKLPEAKKPIIIHDDPPTPEPEPEPKEPSPVPEHIPEKKAHSSKADARDEIDFDAANNRSDVTNRTQIDDAYGNDDDGREVKLYEVVQTVPDSSVESGKKKTKKSHTAAAQMKELKKQKKLKMLMGGESGKMNKVLSKGLANSPKKGMVGEDISGFPPYPDQKPGADILSMRLNSKAAQKKLNKLESLKRKRKKDRLLAAMPYPPSDHPELKEKQRKKRMSKLSKKNLASMGLNPDSIEGFAVINPTNTDYNMPPYNRDGGMEASFSGDTIKTEMPIQPKESQKKAKKLSNEPDKQKIKFFKKLTSTAQMKANAMDAMNRDDLGLPIGYEAAGEVQRIRMAEKFSEHTTSYQSMQQVAQMQSTSHDLSSFEQEPSAKKAKLLKKLNKPPKEPKIPKIKKLKKESPTKKPRTPKNLLGKDQLSVDFGASAASSTSPTSSKVKSAIPPFFPNMGFLDPSFSGPGLIPSNPLFQSVRFDMPHSNQMQNYPFPLPGFSLNELSRFKRPNFNEPQQNDLMHSAVKHPHFPDTSSASAKPLCNVAPLMPPSLLNQDMNSFRIEQPSASHSMEYNQHQPFSKKKSDAPISPKFANLPTAQVHEKHIDMSSPIVIDSEDDDKFQSNSRSMVYSIGSPDCPQDSALGDDSKRHSKKLKDKSSSEKKKEKRDKDGSVKVKKKKDKKDKSKNKSEKHANREGGDHIKPVKDKAALKKEKREKKKEKDRLAAAAAAENSSFGEISAIATSFAKQDWQRDAFIKDDHHSSHSHTHLDNSEANEFGGETSNLETSAIPKLTLKLAPSSSSPSSRPSTPDFPASQRKSSKKKKKQWRALDDESDKSPSDMDDVKAAISKIDESNYQVKREPSPEIARISALITRPPKQKSSTKQQNNEFSSSATGGRNDFFDARTNYHSSIATSTPLPATPSGRGRPKGSTSAKSSKTKPPKASTSFPAAELESSMHSIDNQSVPEKIDRQINVLHTVDEQTNEENQVWICPACGRVDDGTPMIGCDGCDDWYHWVCVGIQVPPDQDQDWFCRVCILKKQEDKKKKRKKKDKKEH